MTVKLKPKQTIIALDVSSLEETKNLLSIVDKDLFRLKVGKQLFTSQGPKAIDKLISLGFDIFLDLKLHDIPNTVKKSIESLTSLPIKMLTVHTSGGKDMMSAAMEAVSGTGIKVFGVTVLTSLSDQDTAAIFNKMSSEQVEAMLDVAESASIDGVVCSPHELMQVKKRESLLSITPGIRLQDSDDDQKRVMTPKKAIDLGADYLVIGRPITSSENIGESLNEIFQSIQ